MKLSIALSALLVIGFIAASAEQASSAVVYCQYVDYPAGCVLRPGVVLRPRPVVVAPVARPVARPVDRPVDREIRR